MSTYYPDFSNSHNDDKMAMALSIPTESIDLDVIQLWTPLSPPPSESDSTHQEEETSDRLYAIPSDETLQPSPLPRRTVLKLTDIPPAAAGSIRLKNAYSAERAKGFANPYNPKRALHKDEKFLASEEGKKLTPKEGRQLRNKVSARNFRVRRKGKLCQMSIAN